MKPAKNVKINSYSAIAAKSSTEGASFVNRRAFGDFLGRLGFLWSGIEAAEEWRSGVIAVSSSNFTSWCAQLEVLVLVVVLKMRKWLGQLAQLDAQSFNRNDGGLRNYRI